MTSSDVLDSAFALQLLKALELVLDGAKQVAKTLRQLVLEHKDTVMVGRTHGVHAERYSFGLKVLSWLKELERNLERLESAKEQLSYGKISGAIGTYAHLPPQIEALALKKLGLKPEPISTQVVPRDRHAYLFFGLALLAAGIERIALEIRHLQRTEVLELEEPFGRGQRGSSAMPHKKNPILCENLCGLARLMRSYIGPTLENIALWHERDISHSSVERVIGEDALVLADFMLHRLLSVLKGLVVHKDRMLCNLESLGGMVYSQRILLALTERGMERTKAYEIVQNSAMEALLRGASFKEIIMNNPYALGVIPKEELEGLFSFKPYLRHIDTVYERCLNSSLGLFEPKL
jgi:adenylosuccinate lyase